MTIEFTDKIQFNGQVNVCDVCYDIGNDKYVVAFIPDDGSAYQGDFCVRVATRTGNELTFGDIVVVQADTLTRNDISIVYNEDTGKIVVRTYYNSVYVGTISGDTITFGSPTYPLIGGKFVSFDNKIALVEDDIPGNIVIGEISGDSITWGSIVNFGTDVYSVGPCYDIVNDRLVISYVERSTTPDEARAVVCSISGTVPTVGTPVIQYVDVLSSLDAHSSCYDNNSGKVICVTLLDATTDVLVATAGTVSGMTISFTSPVVVVDTTFVTGLDSVYNPDTKSCNFVYRNWDNNHIEMLDLSYDGGIVIDGVYEMYGSSTSFSSTACDYDGNVNSLVTVVNHESENSADVILSIYTPELFWRNNQGHVEV